MIMWCQHLLSAGTGELGQNEATGQKHVQIILCEERKGLIILQDQAKMGLKLLSKLLPK